MSIQPKFKVGDKITFEDGISPVCAVGSFWLKKMLEIPVPIFEVTRVGVLGVINFKEFTNGNEYPHGLIDDIFRLATDDEVIAALVKRIEILKTKVHDLYVDTL